MAAYGSARAVVVAFALAMVAAACGSSAPPPAPSATASAPAPSPAPSDGTLPDASCRADGDCIVSTWSSDCCCPCTPLHAISATYEAERQARAARMHCNRSTCAASACTPCASVPSGVRAVCTAGACTLASP